MPAAALLSLVLLSATAVVPPLTDGQTGRLETARDGRDHREEAFVALVENARSFSGVGAEVAGPAAVHLEPDIEALLADPDGHRGALCRITGVLQQATPLARPHADATEWFVRDSSDRPILVYVVGLSADDRPTFVPDRRVVVYARFYKRVDAEARDGTTHQYAAFVGARPWLAAVPGADSAGLPLLFSILVIALVGLGAVFIVLTMLTRRQRRHARPRRVGMIGRDVEELDDQPPLPDDPAEALAELKRRAAEEA